MMLWTDNQRAAIEAYGDLCVDAGAGSGKTRVLVHRIMQLLENGRADLDDIVAITFTDFAATEMRQRLRGECRRRESDDSETMSYWRGLSRRVETARIQTIHGFCAALLRENALAVGIDPDFTMLAEAETRLLVDEVVRETLHALLRQGDPAALRLGVALGVMLLVDVMKSLLAKRAVMEMHLAQSPRVPEQLLVHWQRLMQDDERARLATLRYSPDFVRLHRGLWAFDDSGCLKNDDGRKLWRLRMLELCSAIAGGADTARVRAMLQALAADEVPRAIKKNWSDESALKKLKSCQDELYALARELSESSVDPDVEAEAAQQVCDLYDLFEKIAAAFAQAKQARNGLDFEDLIIGAAALLENSSDARARATAQVRYLLVDEFQDTDALQERIIAALKSHAGDALEVFVVGDAKQSIYRFRGADVDVFQRAKQHRQVIPLEKNFRSVPQVLGFVNHVFAESGLLCAVTETYEPMVHSRTAADECRVEFLVPLNRDEKTSADKWRSLEADMIAGRIAEMCSGAAPVSVGDGRPACYGDIAILFRSTGSTHIFERSLRERGIPYTVVAGTGFFRCREIADLLCLFRVVLDPWDEYALAAFLRSPMACLTDDSLFHLSRRGGLAAAFWSDALPEGLAQTNELTRARDLIAKLRCDLARPLPVFVRRALEQTGYEAVTLSQYLGVQKTANVRKLLDLADDFTRTSAPRLADFVRYLDELGRQESLREGEAALLRDGANAVTLMTIHKSKGLQFPIVFVPDICRVTRGDTSTVGVDSHLGVTAKVRNEKGDYNHSALSAIRSRREKDADGAESARVLYVALTRAEDWLILSGAPEPKKHSWMETFDLLFQLTGRRHEEVISGNGWSACVRREAPPPSRQAQRQGQNAPCDTEALRRRIAPVMPAPARQPSYSVSRLTQVMAGFEPYAAATPAAPISGLDPATRGNVFHRLLQLWDFVSPVAPCIERALRREDLAEADEYALAAELTSMAAAFQQSALARRLMAAPGLLREVPFTLRLNGGLVRGAMDVFVPGELVLDYKSGRHKDLSHAAYEWQVRLYALAVRNISGMPPAQGGIYYIGDNEFVPVNVGSDILEETAARAAQAMARIDALIVVPSEGEIEEGG